MKAPPDFARFLAMLCLLFLCLLFFGCASTTQTMQPPTGKLDIEVKGLPDGVAGHAGNIVVIVGAQIGVTAKPVGLDILNPAASIAAQQNSGTSNSNANAGDVSVDKAAPAVRSDGDSKPAATKTATPKTEEEAEEPAADTSGGG